MSRRAVPTLAAVLLAAVLAAPSQAARPVVLGAGSDPGVAIDSTGTAHVAYNAEFESIGPGRFFDGALGPGDQLALSFPTLGYRAGSRSPSDATAAAWWSGTTSSATGCAPSGSTRAGS